MKKWLSRIAGWVLALLSFVLALTFFFPILHYYPSYRFPVYSAYTVPPDTDRWDHFSLPDTLPYGIYKQRMDSFNMVKNAYLLYMQHALGNGLLIGSFGVQTSMECDSCLSPYTIDNELNRNTRYYIVLHEYQPATDEASLIGYQPVYYGRSGKTYKKYVNKDSATIPLVPKGQSSANDRHFFGHWETKELEYRTADVVGGLPEHKNILIPVSKNTHTVFKILCWAGLVLLVLAIIYFVVINSVRVIMEVARGRAFSTKNYRRLFLMAYCLAGIQLVNLLFQVTGHLVCKDRYAGDWIPYVEWMEVGRWMTAALVLWFVALAFRKGYQIKQEQDLTI
jgi:hypothetical protein